MGDELRHPMFPGRQRLLGAIDAAVMLGEPSVITRTLEQVLREAIHDPAITLPACVQTPVAGRYARRELHRSRALGYSVVAMCWGPGDGTPLHDHGGLWCVEGVWQGELVVTPYDLLEDDGDRFRFAAQPRLRGTFGSAGSLIPPFEYHTLRNASERQVAVSVHVYQGPMESSAVFDPLGDGWYARQVRALEADPV